MGNDWKDVEVRLIVEDYFSMLVDELIGKSYNKTHHRNGLMPFLENKSSESIEFKHQNISAALIKLGLPYIKGYKPRWNYQQVIEDEIISYLKRQKSSIEPKFIQFADSKNIPFHNVSFNSIIDSPPERRGLLSEPKLTYKRRPIKINYLEREQNNIYLGERGERFVLNFEKWRLIEQGKYNLADRVEWISQSDDGAGFDILSKNEDGSDRYIEVKTTKLSKDTPIYFTKNEYQFSLSKKADFHLYRLFNFDQIPKMFTLKGSYDQFCSKEVTQYRGFF